MGNLVLQTESLWDAVAGAWAGIGDALSLRQDRDRPLLAPLGGPETYPGLPIATQAIVDKVVVDGGNVRA
jgi:hypothetical protein